MIHFEKTIEKKRLIFPGRTGKLVFMSLIASIYLILAIILSYKILTTQIDNNPEFSDYLIGIFFPLLLLGFLTIMIHSFIKRDKLTKIDFDFKETNTRLKILQTAITLNWDPGDLTNNYFEFISDKQEQIITIIFHKNGEILFNCMDLGIGRGFIRNSRSEYNLNLFTNQLEKSICLDPDEETTGIINSVFEYLKDESGIM